MEAMDGKEPVSSSFFVVLFLDGTFVRTALLAKYLAMVCSLSGISCISVRLDYGLWLVSIAPSSRAEFTL